MIGIQVKDKTEVSNNVFLLFGIGDIISLDIESCQNINVTPNLLRYKPRSDCIANEQVETILKCQEQ